MRTTTIPEAIRICEQCGDVASGIACETCATIHHLAETAAAHWIATGKPLVFDPAATLDGVEMEWRAAVTEAYHRQRAAQLYSSLPRVDGQKPKWMGRLGGWLASMIARAWDWLILSLAVVAFWSASRAELKELDAENH